MSKRRRRTQKAGMGRLIAVGLAISGVALLGILVARRPASPDSGRLLDSQEAFSVPDHVGQLAPAFTAIGVDGQPYPVSPGDGRPKVLVFYMGYL